MNHLKCTLIKDGTEAVIEWPDGSKDRTMVDEVFDGGKYARVYMPRLSQFVAVEDEETGDQP